MAFILILNIDWENLLLGSIIGTFIGLILAWLISKCKTKLFTKTHLTPLKGNYKATYKNGKEATEIKEVKITTAKNKTLFIETTNNKGIKSESEVFFESPNYGKGWYIETEDEDKQDKKSKTFGYREIIIKKEKQELYVWNRYSKDNAYGDKADFTTVNKGYIWLKQNSFTQ